jgi:hypothetical protein
MTHIPMIRTLSLIALVVTAGSAFISRPMPAAPPTITVSFDVYDSWQQFDAGWQAFARDDFVEAYRLLTRAWLHYEGFRGHPDSPFPPAQQFYDQFKGALEYSRAELAYFSQVYPSEARQQLTESNRKLSECNARLRQTGTTERSSGEYSPPPVRRPPKPDLYRLPPPRR